MNIRQITFEIPSEVLLVLKVPRDEAGATVERALIAHCLISSLDTRQDKGVDQAWGELAEQRYEELVSGKVAPVSWNDIKKEVKGCEG